MKKLISNRAVSAALFFALGGASAWGATKYFERKNATPRIAPPQVAQEEELNHDPIEKYFADAFGQESALKEDENFLKFEIDLEGQTPKEVNVQVQDGQVFITGKTETKEENDGAESFFSSTFHQSFPVPPNVDGEKYTVEKEDGKIVVKFPKKKV